MNDYQRILLAELQVNGIYDGCIIRDSKHPRLWFTHEGRRKFFVLPSTPGDSTHGPWNARADLRRLIGATSKQKESPPPKVKRAYRKAVERPQPAPLQITVIANPFASLAIVSDAMDRAKDASFEAGKMAFLCGLGNTALTHMPEYACAAFRKGWAKAQRLTRELA